MSFETALVEELSVGELANKVFPLSASEGTKAPYLVYLSSEGIQDKTLQGYLDTKEVSCELNIVHTKYEYLKPLVAAVLTKLRSFQGRSIGSSGPFIQNFTYDEPVDLFEPEVKQWRCNISFEVYF